MALLILCPWPLISLSGIINVDAEIALHGHDQAQGNDHGGGAGTQRDQEIGDLAAPDAGALEQIAHGAGDHDAHGGGHRREEQGVFQAVHGEAVQHYLNSVRMNRSYVYRGNLDPEISVLIKKYGLNKDE